MKQLNPRIFALALSLVVFFVGLGTGAALSAQSHMLSARSYLYDALSQLEAAVPDKAGHRVQAVQLVKDALNQVDLGIRAGAR